MKPLLSVICYNRKRETEQTLLSLWETGAFEQASVKIVDNASVDGTGDLLDGLIRKQMLLWGQVERLSLNVGCPRALNRTLFLRKPGQHFIKVDNDVVLQTPNWVTLLCDFLERHPDVAMVSPWYEELETTNQGRIITRHEEWWEVFPVVGHCVLHRGTFLDQTGYFDVLADDHLYGFEDLLMAHRAASAGYRCAVCRLVKLKNVQRHNSLDDGAGSIHDGEDRETHIARLRPEYERRIRRIHKRLWAYRVDRNGQEVKCT